MEVEYKLRLGSDQNAGDYLSIFIRTTETVPRRMEHFSVQYVARIVEHEYRIIRYDSSHGTPHRHRFNKTGQTTDRRAYPNETLDQMFDRAKNDLTKNWRRFRDEFIREEGL